MERNIDITKGPTKKQIKMLEDATKLSLPEDDEYPEFSEEELAQFHKISDERNQQRQKQTITLRLSAKAISKAKSLGKGYTSVLSRILESALENPDTIKHFL